MLTQLQISAPAPRYTIHPVIKATCTPALAPDLLKHPLQNHTHYSFEHFRSPLVSHSLRSAQATSLPV